MNGKTQHYVSVAAIVAVTLLIFVVSLFLAELLEYQAIGYWLLGALSFAAVVHLAGIAIAKFKKRSPVSPAPINDERLRRSRLVIGRTSVGGAGILGLIGWVAAGGLEGVDQAYSVIVFLSLVGAGGLFVVARIAAEDLVSTLQGRTEGETVRGAPATSREELVLPQLEDLALYCGVYSIGLAVLFLVGAQGQGLFG